MNILLNTIQSLTKEEIRYYKIFTKKTHTETKRKDILLFDLIRKNISKYNEQDISSVIYGDNKNSFYQLKNKLLQSVNRSIISQYSFKDDDSLIYNFILLAKIFKQKGDFRLAYSYFKKAEKKANQIEAFETLSTIYTEILKLSYDLVSIDIEKYINRKKMNKRNLNLSQDIDIALSSAMYKIKTAQNFSNNEDEVSKKLDEIISSISSRLEVSESPKFRIKLFQAISRVLLQKNDFITLEEYLRMTYDSFMEDRLFNKSNHEDKLMMLTYFTNSLYKNNKLEESLLMAEKLHESMHEFDGLLKSKFLFYYYNALVINYSKLDKDKALLVLREARDNKTIKELPVFGSFIYLNMGLIYYDQKKYRLSIKQISRLILQKDFVNLDLYFQLKILISEIIIRYNLDQIDLIIEKLRFIKRRYKSIISQNLRDRVIINIIERLICSDNIINDKLLIRDIKNLKSMSSQKNAENTDIINYNEWIDSIFKK